MSILYTGNNGTKLQKIISDLGNKDYDVIEFRCLWKDQDGNSNDDLFGYAQYKDGELISLDGDSYSLQDLYIKWEELTDKDGDRCLTVWEDGYLE